MRRRVAAAIGAAVLGLAVVSVVTSKRDAPAALAVVERAPADVREPVRWVERRLEVWSMILCVLCGVLAAVMFVAWSNVLAR